MRQYRLFVVWKVGNYEVARHDLVTKQSVTIGAKTAK